MFTDTGCLIKPPKPSAMRRARNYDHQKSTGTGAQTIKKNPARQKRQKRQSPIPIARRGGHTATRAYFNSQQLYTLFKHSHRVLDAIDYSIRYTHSATGL